MPHLPRAACLIGLVSLLAGCKAGITEPAPVVANCPTPLQGSRYAVCGRLSTNGDALSSGTEVIGSVNSATAGTSVSSSTYSVQGGTFHASH